MTGRGRTRSAAYLTAVLLASASGGLASAQTTAGSQQALAATGAAAFQAVGCANCHFKDSIDAPPLEGVAGRNIASVRGFLYSAGLKAVPGDWSDAKLDAFLAAPQTFAPGVGMDEAVEDPAQRRAIIAYLKTLK